MRAFDAAIAALMLLASALRPPHAAPKLVPAVDAPSAAMLDRAALPTAQVALIASLWAAPTYQCLATPVFELLPAPAVLGASMHIGTTALSDARMLQALLQEAFPRADAGAEDRPHARAA